MYEKTMRRITITKIGIGWSLTSTLNPEFPPDEIAEIGGEFKTGKEFILGEAVYLLTKWIAAAALNGKNVSHPEPEVQLVGGKPEDWARLHNAGEKMVFSSEEFEPKHLEAGLTLLLDAIATKEEEVRARLDRRKKGESFSGLYEVPVKIREEDISGPMRFALLAALIGSTTSRSFAEELLEVHEVGAIETAAAITRARPDLVARAVRGENWR